MCLIVPTRKSGKIGIYRPKWALRLLFIFCQKDGNGRPLNHKTAVQTEFGHRTNVLLLTAYSVSPRFAFLYKH